MPHLIWKPLGLVKPIAKFAYSEPAHRLQKPQRYTFFYKHAVYKHARLQIAHILNTLELIY